ncbi:hypothetical protein [Agromyces sp. Marseille-Q5079]|uniref:hypothetical protein n=1 Tax=Agromyces sp. Marseille-Q5079 TaxID=3439059 RepID=UPI003D9C88AA
MGETESMLTLHDARAAFARYLAVHPLPVVGTFHIDGWYEDDDDFLPVWGSREFSVDHRREFGRMDSLVVFIDKRTGEVRRDLRFGHVEKLRAMTPVEDRDGVS